MYAIAQTLPWDPTVGGGHPECNQIPHGRERAPSRSGRGGRVPIRLRHHRGCGSTRCAGPPPCPADDKDIPMTALTSRADVPTDAAARYAKQLLSHLGRRVTWTTAGDTSTAQIAGGTGRVVVGDGVLTLIAEAADTETLTRVRHVLGSHLERFAQRQGLQVSWVRDGAGVPGPPPAAPTPPQPPTPAGP